MKINQKIISAANFNPTKMTHQMSVEKLCQKVKDASLTLPNYQRDVSWTLQKSVDLFNYQLFGKAPVAAISMNQITKPNNNDVPQITFVSREVIDSSKIEASHQSVVDGQQRITTNFKAFINSDSFRNVVLDFSSATFKIVEGEIKKNQIPVGILMNEDPSLLQEYLTKNNTLKDLFAISLQVRQKLLGYNYTLNIAEDLNEDEQIQWFEVLNNAGSKVTRLQMAWAKLKIHDFDIYNDYVVLFKNLIDDYGFEDLFSPFTTNVSYPICLMNPGYEVICNQPHKSNYAPIASDLKEQQLTVLPIEQIRKIISVSLEALEKSLKFITSNNLSKIVDRMDYILYIAGYYCFNPNESVDDNEYLNNWMKNINFINESNGNRRKIFDDLISIK